jgi:hypothetical protein
VIRIKAPVFCRDPGVVYAASVTLASFPSAAVAPTITVMVSVTRQG